MTYVVMTNGKKGMFLFLVDRTKIKDRWWSYDWADAMQFHKQDAAKTQARKLRYKEPEVITINEAIKLTKRNDANYDYEVQEHLFSSDALGQY